MLEQPVGEVDRPAGSGAAGVILLLLGALRLVLAGTGLSYLASAGQSFRARPLLLGIGVVMAVVQGLLGVAQVIGWWGVRRGNGARIASLATTVALVVSIAGVVGTLVSGPLDPVALAVWALFLAADAAVLALLWRSGRWVSRTANPGP